MQHRLTPAQDGYHRKVLSNLSGFVQWLTNTGAKGYVSEVGWPSSELRTALGPDAAPYEELAMAWYRAANLANLWVTAYGASEGDAFQARQLTAYGPSGPSGSATVARTQATVIERYPTTANYMRGVVCNGGEREQTGFSAGSRGTYGTDYIYPSQNTINFLYSHGVRLIRLPIKWERLQPVLGAALNTTEVSRINTVLGYASAAGSDMKVILAPYNYGGYKATTSFNVIGSATVSSANYTNFWSLMSNTSSGFGAHAAIQGFSLMHQPNAGGAFAMGVTNWQTYSQNAVTAIRSNTTTKSILVAIYGTSGQMALDNHPSAWITDAQNLTRYEAMHWFDGNDIGAYTRSYANQRQVWFAPTSVDRGIGTATHGFYDEHINQNPTTAVASSANVGGDTLDEAARISAQMPSIVQWYVPWLVTGYQDFPLARIQMVEQRGASPYITWEPVDWTLPINVSGNANYQILSKILSGTYNTYIDAWAVAARNYGKPLRVRLMHEFNDAGGTRAWVYNDNGNTGAAQFVSAWQFVVNRVRAQGAWNVRWVWCPAGSNSATITTTILNSLYPGDGYVDETAIDVYNVGTSGITWGGGVWRTLTQQLTTGYTNVTGTVAPSKPFHIAEFSSTESGGDKAAWIRNAYETELPTTFPLVKYALWFNSDNTTQVPAETNWRFDSSTAARDAYREVVATTYWQRPLRVQDEY